MYLHPDREESLFATQDDIITQEFHLVITWVALPAINKRIVFNFIVNFQGTKILVKVKVITINLQCIDDNKLATCEFHSEHYIVVKITI